VALDPKKRELLPFAKVPHLLHAVASSPLEISRLLSWATAELDRRTDTGRTRPRLVIVAEELADVLATSPGAGEQIARLAQLGRGLGVTLIGTTQQPGARSLGDALPNFPARLIGRIASATLTFGATGKARTQADQLIGKGDFLLITGDGTTRLQVPLIDGRLLGTLPHAAEVASLADELPAVATFADLARDTRGGYGRRELTASDYQAIDRALAEGASISDLRAQFGLGYERARRIVADYRGETE
jgi:DNA segregation ATPase FtsK/SpoIIIE, S-DNA-T family